MNEYNTIWTIFYIWESYPIGKLFVNSFFDDPSLTMIKLKRAETRKIALQISDIIEFSILGAGLFKVRIPGWGVFRKIMKIFQTPKFSMIILAPLKFSMEIFAPLKFSMEILSVESHNRPVPDRLRSLREVKFSR